MATDSTPGFRVRTITLDGSEDVESVTAVVRPVTLEVIHKMLGAELSLSWVSPGEVHVELPLALLGKLFAECGQVRGIDEIYPHTHAVYDSLAPVWYGLVSDD